MVKTFQHESMVVPKSYLEGTARFIAILVTALGLIVLLGWLLNITFLKNLLPDLPTMKFNTALLFALCGIALFSHAARTSLARACAVAVLIVALLTLSEYLFNTNLGIDELFVRDVDPSVLSGAYPGRMSVITAINFSLSAVGLLALAHRQRLSQLLALLILLLSMLAIVGYIYDLETLNQIFPYSTMAIHTAVAFVLVSIALFLLQTKTELMQIIFSNRISGTIVRRLIPLAFFLPLFLGWLRLYGSFIGLYNNEFGSAITSVLNMVILLATTWWIVRFLDGIDGERLQALEALQQSQTELQQRVLERTQELETTSNILRANEERFRLLVSNVQDYAIYMLDPEGNIVSWNEGAESIKGYSQEEILGQNFSRFFLPEDAANGEPQRILNLAKELGHYNTEGWRRRKSGEKFWANVVVTALRGETGELIGFSKITRDLTEFKKTEQSLKDSEARFRRAIIDAPFPVMIHAEDGEILHISNIWTELSGYTHDDIPTIGDWTERAYHERKNTVKPIIDSVYARDEPLRGGEFTIHTKDNKIRIWDFIAAPLGPLPDGRRMVSSMAMDITERKHAEALLRESEDRFRTIAELLPAPMQVTRASDGIILYANPAFGEMVGQKSENLIGQTVLDLYYKPEERSEMVAHVRERGFVNNAEFQGKSPTTGKPFWAYVSAQFITFNNESAIVAVFVDITERKRLEEAIKQSEALLSQVLNILPVGVWILDTTGAFTHTNQAGKHMWAGAENADPDITGEYKAWWVESGERIKADEWSVQRSLTNGESTINEEIEIECFDGTHKYILNSSLPIKDDKDKIIGAVTVNQDITSLKQVQVELKRNAQALETSNQELQAFVYTASHDLQEPLWKIQAFGDRLVSTNGENFTEQGKDYLERMINASTRMRTLIENLLEYSRVTRTEKAVTPVDLNSVISLILSDLELSIEKSGATIRVDTLTTIDANKTHMRQLFQNLISNALKFHIPGQPPIVQITGRFVDDNSLKAGVPNYELVKYEITVSDKGIGFDEKYASRIFGMFERLHGRAKYSGTGIGLAICHKIVLQHNGTIVAHSAKGKGASFVITLPVHQTQQEP